MSDKDNKDELKLKIEAVLFAYGDWLTPESIMESVGVSSKKSFEGLMGEVVKKYEMGFPFMVQKGEDERWKMSLKEEYEGAVSELVSGVEIPKNVLKILSVIAYEQPVTKTRLAEILGRSVKPEVDYLYKAKFVYYEKNGIGKYYKVTKKFYEYFKIDEEEDFRSKANENLKTFLEEPSTSESVGDEKQE